MAAKRTAGSTDGSSGRIVDEIWSGTCPTLTAKLSNWRRPSRVESAEKADSQIVAHCSQASSSGPPTWSQKCEERPSQSKKSIQSGSLAEGSENGNSDRSNLYSVPSTSVRSVSGGTALMRNRVFSPTLAKSVTRRIRTSGDIVFFASSKHAAHRSLLNLSPSAFQLHPLITIPRSRMVRPNGSCDGGSETKSFSVTPNSIHRRSAPNQSSESPKSPRSAASARDWRLSGDSATRKQLSRGQGIPPITSARIIESSAHFRRTSAKVLLLGFLRKWHNIGITSQPECCHRYCAIAS